MLRRYIGDKAFYRRVIAVALPIIIQNGICNFVSLLDNIMVGQIGTAEMSGVAIINQLMFVFNLCVFGATSGAGIFTAQFHGSANHDGIRHTFRYKMLIGGLISALGIGVFLLWGQPLAQLYLQGEGNPEDAIATLGFAWQYLLIMLWSLPAFAISNAYASTLRETGQTVVPMIASTVAVFVNLILNWILIFGQFGIAPMGVQGAAIATVISRYVELAIVAFWAHRNQAQLPYMQGIYRSLYIPGELLGRITLKGMPLLINEALWSIGMAVLSQCYSTRGLDVVAATNISSTVYNLSSVVYLALGNAVGILIGQMLGSGESEERIRDADRKLIFVSVSSCMVFGGLMAASSGLFPQIYDTTNEVRSLAAKLICISAIFLPFNAYTNAAYFTLRSGGQTMVTFLFDSCFVWLFCVPLALFLSHCTGISILPLYIICQATDLIKCALGAFMIKQGKWIQNLTNS